MYPEKIDQSKLPTIQSYAACCPQIPTELDVLPVAAPLHSLYPALLKLACRPSGLEGRSHCLRNECVITSIQKNCLARGHPRYLTMWRMEPWLGACARDLVRLVLNELPNRLTQCEYLYLIPHAFGLCTLTYKVERTKPGADLVARPNWQWKLAIITQSPNHSITRSLNERTQSKQQGSLPLTPPFPFPDPFMYITSPHTLLFITCCQWRTLS